MSNYPKLKEWAAEWSVSAEAFESLLCLLSMDEPKPKKKPCASPEVIESIYLLYPRKSGKASALKAIGKALNSGVSVEFLTEAVTAYAAAVEAWPENDRKFVPHPATWFNGGRWEDDRKEWNRNRGGKNGIARSNPEWI